MLYDEPAMTSNWSEISLGSMGPDYEQEFNGRLQFRGGSRSTSESESIGNDVDLSQKQFAKPQAKNDKGTVLLTVMLRESILAKIVNFIMHHSTSVIFVISAQRRVVKTYRRR